MRHFAFSGCLSRSLFQNPTHTMKTNLLNYNLNGLTDHFAQMGEKPFRAKQVMRWIHQSGAQTFDEMTDLAKALRAKLQDNAVIGIPALMTAQESRDGTRKWLLDVGTGNGVETVFIPEAERGTLCISSQVGCALECTFCSTGRQGFNRNLTAAEISEKALSGTSPLCRLTLDMFCARLGTVASTLALTLGARGGVYLCGGIIPRFIDYFKSSPFRQRFESKGRFDAYLAAIPVYIVQSQYPGIVGAAVALDNHLQHSQ